MKSPKLISLLVSLMAALVGSCTMVQDGAMLRARAALRDGRYRAVLEHATRAESYGETSPAKGAEIGYLRGRGYEGLGRNDEALGAYRYVARTFPDTIWGSQAAEKVKTMQAAGAGLTP